MSIVHLPSTISYWGSTLRNTAITEAMTTNRFEEIKRFFHFKYNIKQRNRD